jgi:DNA repair exonuclease SbcCD ATPase subunit
VKREEIEEYAFEMGYLINEIEEVIKLLESRGYIKYDKDNDILIKQKQISNIDVLNKFEDVVNMAGYVAKIYREYGETPNLSINFNIKNEIKNEYNEDKLHGYLDRINDWERGINVEYNKITKKLTDDKTKMLERINKTIAGLDRIKTNIEEEGEASITCSSLAYMIDHINRIPKDLKKECQKSIRNAKELKESMEYSSSDFSELAKRLKNAKTELNNIKRNQDNINNKYKKWQTWKKLIGDMESIFRSIEEYQEHLDIEEEDLLFKNLINEIQHGFARERDEYLFQEEFIESKINQISNNIKNKERTLRKDFNDKKGDIEAILNSIINDSEILEDNPLRYNIAFSIEDKDTSYQNLNDSVKNDIKNFTLEYNDYIAEVKTKIDMKIENKSEKSELYKELYNIEGEVDSLKQSLYDLDVIEVLDEIRNIKDNLIKLGQEIKEIDKTIKRKSVVKEYTAEEKRILEILNREKEMPLGRLIKNSGMDIEEVIRCLNKLDNHMEIIVRKK